MRGALQARTARLPTIRVLRWSSWTGLSTRRPRQVSGERLEVIERLASEQRRARRSGDGVHDLARQWRWR